MLSCDNRLSKNSSRPNSTFSFVNGLSAGMTTEVSSRPNGILSLYSSACTSLKGTANNSPATIHTHADIETVSFRLFIFISSLRALTEVSLRFGYTCEPNVLLFKWLAAPRPHWHPSHESPHPPAFGRFKSRVRCPLLRQASDHPCRLFIHLHTHGPQNVCQLTQGLLSRWKDVPGCSH